MSVIHRFYETKFAPSEGDTKTFSGYASVFGVVDSYGDVIEKGAFAQSIYEAKNKGAWPAMLLQHGGYGMMAEDMSPIGIWLDLSEDDIGLKSEGKLADTQRGADTYQLMKMEPRPAITGLSIGYIPIKWDNRREPEDPRRRLREVKLFEISPVTFPANAEARVSEVKSLESMSEIEGYLREACGLSRSEARRLIYAVKRCDGGLREADPDPGIASAIELNIKRLRGR